MNYGPFHSRTEFAGLVGLLCVLSACAGGGSEMDSGGSGDPRSAHKRPAAPVGVDAEPGNGKVSLRWAPVARAVSYRLYWSHSPIVVVAAVQSVDDVVSPFDHSGLTNGRDYHYVLVAVNGAGEGPASPESSTVPSALYEPAWANSKPHSTLTLDFDPVLSDVRNGDRLARAIRGLVPGQELQVGTGVYSVGSKLEVDLSGSSELPIWIVAKPGATPVLTRPNASQNTLNLGVRARCAYLCLRGFEITGGDTAIKMYLCSHVWIDRCHIHHCDGAGISANSADTDRLFLTANEIHHTGGTAEGMYLGANFGKYVMRESVIVRNHVYECRGTQGDGIEVKQGSHSNWIAENVIHDCRYPCITVYGTGGRAPNVIERNICYRSDDNVMQVQGEAVVRNNLLIAGATGFHSHDHQGRSRDLVFVHNTIINERCGADLGSWGGRSGMVFANNVVYSRTEHSIRFSGGAGGVTIAGNVVLGEVVGVRSASFLGSGLSDFRGVSWDGRRRDATPSEGAVIAGAGDGTWAVHRDVLGHVRGGRLGAGCYDVRE